MNALKKAQSMFQEAFGRANELAEKSERTADENAELATKTAEAKELKATIEGLQKQESDLAELRSFNETPGPELPRGRHTTFTPDGSANVKSGEGGDSFEFSTGGISEKQHRARSEKSYGKAWGRMIRGIADGADMKALNEGQDEFGGYLVPAQMESEILREESRIPGLLNAIGRRTTSSNRVIFPTMPYSDPAEIQANPYFQQFVGENGAPTNQPDLKFGEKTIDVHRAAFEVPYSADLADDTGDILLQEIRAAAEESYTLGLERFVTAGTGVGQPRGIMQGLAPGGQIEVINMGTVINALTMPQLIKFTHQLPIQYRAGAGYYMSDEVFAELCSVTDSNNNLVNMFGRVDKDQGLVNSFQPTLMGRPVDVAPYLPSPGLNNIIMLFGQFARAYYLVTRRGLTVTPISEQSDKYRGSGMRALHFSYRVGGDLVRPWAIKAGKQA